MQKILRLLLVLSAGASAATWGLACGDDASSGAASSDFDQGPGDFNNSTPSNNNVFVPEPEARLSFQRPQPSQRFVFVASPELDSVAKINALTLEITSVEVGDRPTLVRTSPSTDTAVVLNEGSDEVSVVHAGLERDEVVHLPVRAGFNNLVLSPDGAWALAWLDPTLASNDAALGSFQDVNLIRTEDGEEAVFNVAVGFRVLDIRFDETSEHAFVLTEDGVSVLELARIDRDTSAPPRAVSDDPLADAEADDREIEITQDGAFALVRSSVLEGLNLVALQGPSQIRFLPLPGIPTDVDLYPDSQRAVTVIRGQRQLGVVDLAALLRGDEDAARLIEIPDGPVGQAVVDTDADRAFLYSVAEQDSRVVRVDLDTEQQQVWELRKPITGVQIAPSGRRAVVFHGSGASGDLTEAADQLVASRVGYTILDLRSGFAKLQTTDSLVLEHAFSVDGAWIYMILANGTYGPRIVERANLDTFRVDRYTLASPPLHIGALPGEATYDFYVAQDHPSGRMTFFAITDEASKTVTGFELNAQIE